MSSGSQTDRVWLPGIAGQRDTQHCLGSFGRVGGRTCNHPTPVLAAIDRQSEAAYLGSRSSVGEAWW